MLIVGIVAVGGFWLWKEFTKPLPGDQVKGAQTENRSHVTDISGIAYDTNPPTGGPHFPVWAKKGVYDRAISDGYLLHSLEHGYVVISYNCTKLISNLPALPAGRQFPISNVYAHETGEVHEEPVATESGQATPSGQPLMHMNYAVQGNMSWFTPDNPPAKEVDLPESFNSQECKDLVSKLSEMTKVAERVMVVPRLANDSLIALTAWGRIEKLDKFDKDKIENFIKSWHNRGPEKTVE